MRQHEGATAGTEKEEIDNGDKCGRKAGVRGLSRISDQGKIVAMYCKGVADETSFANVSL